MDYSGIHGIIFPGDVRPADRIKARIRKVGDQSFSDVRVWRLSPLGIELAYEDLQSAPNVGDSLDLEVVIAGERSSFYGLVVGHTANATQHQLYIVGVRFAQEENDSKHAERRRSTERWLCSEDYLPTAVCASPGRFNDYCYFRIRDISKDGLKLMTSLRNKFLVPGVHLSVIANFPVVGEAQFRCEVVHTGVASEHGKETLAIGAKFSTLPSDAKRTIGQYLVQFSTADSLEDLRSAGFKPSSISLGTDFYFLKSERDYEDVLELRYQSNSVEGNLRPGVAKNDMADIADSRARIIVGKRNGKVIATARIAYCDPDVELEQANYVDVPVGFPKSNQILEVTRACTHPDYRRGDLLAAMFRFACAACFSLQRRYVVIMCTKPLIEFYEKLGWESTGLDYEHPLYTKRQYVMISDSAKALGSGSGHPIYWNFVWREVSDYVISAGLINPVGVDRVRLTCYRALGVASKLFFAARAGLRARRR